jgi:hypothetical protein
MPDGPHPRLASAADEEWAEALALLRLAPPSTGRGSFHQQYVRFDVYLPARPLAVTARGERGAARSP